MRVVQQGDIRFGKRRQLKKKGGGKREAHGLRAPACVCSCSWIVSPLALLLLDRLSRLLFLDRFSCLLFLDRLSRLLFLDSLFRWIVFPACVCSCSCLLWWESAVAGFYIRKIERLFSNVSKILSWSCWITGQVLLYATRHGFLVLGREPFFLLVSLLCKHLIIYTLYTSHRFILWVFTIFWSCPKSRLKPSLSQWTDLSWGWNCGLERFADSPISPSWKKWSILSRISIEIEITWFRKNRATTFLPSPSGKV